MAINATDMSGISENTTGCTLSCAMRRNSIRRESYWLSVGLVRANLHETFAQFITSAVRKGETVTHFLTYLNGRYMHSGGSMAI